MVEHKPQVLSVRQYRTITKDVDSTEEQIKKRIEYLEAMCGNIISNEINNYVKSKKS